MRKVAIVTGGNRGIGLAIIRNMVRDGYVACTIGTSDAFVEEVVKRYGRVDVLVNNAGVAPKKREDVLVCTEESFDRVVGINVKGTLFMTQLVAREMLRQAPCEGRMRGVIVNISIFSSFLVPPSLNMRENDPFQQLHGQIQQQAEHDDDHHAGKYLV